MNNLEKLNLAWNKIQTVGDGTFTGLGNLQELDLGLNEIPNLEVGCFSPLTQLTELGLYKNNLSVIKDNAFTGLGNPQKLWLNLNQISVIESNALSGLSSLQELWVYGTELTTLDSKVLSDVPRPVELGMSDPFFLGGDNPWNCDTLCWLKREEMAGNITWLTVIEESYQPQCAGDVTWENLQCMFFSIHVLLNQLLLAFLVPATCQWQKVYAR